MTDVRAPNSAAGLNELLMATDDEVKIADLLDAEVSGRGRKVFIMRIHSRLNKVRADRERAALLSGRKWRCPS